MRTGRSRRGQKGQISIATLILAVVLTAVLVGGASLFLLKWREKPPEAATMALAETKGPAAHVSNAPSNASTQTPPRELSAEELFKMAAPSVALIEVFGESGERVATASGFIATDTGALITNYHVIRGAHSANAHFQDGSTSPIEGVLGYDAYRDVAVVKVSNVPARALPLGDSGQSQVGDHVVAIGSPLALQNTLSDGLISGIRNGVIQTTAPISHGSSGGPLLNSQGKVIGIAVGMMTQAENLNFAVPINWAKTYLGNPDVTTLADLAKQNTVEKQLVGSTLSVAAGQRFMLPITVDQNQMASPELEGSFSSSGGAGGKIRVVVLDQNSAVYDSGRAKDGTIKVPLKTGTYRLVLDNTGSLMFARSVTADLKLRYVK